MQRKIRAIVESDFGDIIDDFDLPENWDEWSSAKQEKYLIDIAVSHQNNVAPCSAGVVDSDHDTEEP